MISPTILPSLPSTYFATDVEIALISRCINSNRLVNKPFHIEQLVAIANELAIAKRDQIQVFQGLIRHGILYSLSEGTSVNYISLKASYYLDAEKVIQALITNHSELVLGKKLFKFDIDGELFDGGFVSSQKEVFISALEKLQAKYSERGEKATYLPSFIRMYECIGIADGRDFFTQSQFKYGGNSITSRGRKETHPAENLFIIPKYVLINSQKGELLRDNHRICVCIS